MYNPTAILLLTATLSLCPGYIDCQLDTPIITHGIASQYDPGIMSRVARYRLARDQVDSLDGYDGFIAIRECDDIGKVFWIRPVTSVWRWERHLGVDCASKSDARWQDGLSGYTWMIRNNVLVEISFETAQRWRTIGRAIKIEIKEKR